MAVGFSDADFSIVPSGDQLPMPQRDDQGFWRYRALVQFPSRTQYNVLEAYLATISLVPALGGGGTIIAESGGGKHTLTWPAQAGVESDDPAYLVTLDQPQARMTNLGYLTAQAEWILVRS